MKVTGPTEREKRKPGKSPGSEGCGSQRKTLTLAGSLGLAHLPLLPDLTREADFVVAGAAIDGPVVPRQERNGCAHSAIGAYDSMHLSRGGP